MKKEIENSAPKSTEILVVEDSLTQATQIKHLLESHHYKVTVAHDGEEAISKLSKHKPALVISDILMPEMNGYELCKKIKSNKITEDIPVILLTRLVDPEEIIEGLSCGADSFITKPYNEKHLLSNIEKILSKENGADQKKMPFGTQILFKGKKRFIQAEQQNVIELMLDIYEGAIHQNERLFQTREELRLLNERLESMVKDRTSDLSEEIKLSNQITNRLKESEERFRTLYNDAVVGLYRTNSQGEILLVNMAMLKMLGFQSFEELTVKNIKEADYGPSYERQQFIDQIEKEGEVKDMEAIWICRNGKEIFVRESAKAIYDSEGKILYYDGTVQDITEQKKAAEALNKIQHLFETLALVSPVGIFRTDPDGYTTYVNPRYSELTGLSFEEAMGSGWFNAVHSDDREKLKENWSSDSKSQKMSNAEYRFIRPDGSIVWVMGNAVPELIDNEIVGYIGTLTDITDRKRTEDILNHERRMLRTLIDNLPAPISFKDSQGRYILNNTAHLKLIGAGKQKDATGKTAFDFFPEAEAMEYDKDDKHVLSSGEILLGKEEISHDWETGKTYWHLTNKIPLTDAASKVIYLITISHDITQQKLVEEELEKNQIQLINALKLAHLGSWEYDVENDIFIFNDLFYAIFRTTAEQVGGYTMKSADYANRFVHPEDMAVVGSETRKAIETDDPDFSRQLEHRIIYADGETGYITVRFFIVKNEKGKTVRTFGVNQDITERKRGEEVLRESESSLRNAQEIAKMGSWEWDMVTQKTKWSDNFFAVLEFKPAEVEPGFELFRSRIHPDDVHFLDENLAIIMKDKTPSGLELRLIQPDSTVKWIQNNISPVIEDDKLVKLKGVIIDITERKRGETVLAKAAEQMKLAKEKAEASDKLKTAFLNNISHEVRTPLNGILGFAELMSLPDLSDEDKAISLSMLFESSDRLLSTITNFMDISLITSGNMGVNKKDFIPEQIMKELLRKYTTICTTRKFELLLKTPENSDRLSINSDPEIINKIISHLLSNAIKFTEKGNIQYGYNVRKNELEFFVSDTGIGIGKESIISIFEHFEKEYRGPLKLSEGSGLGLSISKGLVELLGGKIWVESEKGKGSGFFFTIPYVKESENHQPFSTARQFKKVKSGTSILVAEDDEANFFYLNALLRSETEASIIHASNGREAVEKFMENPDISLVLMDIKMPVMNGLEATQQIKTINPNVPVIAVTAYAMAGDENKALEAGCDGYLIKPINKKILLEIMAELLSI